MVRAGALDIRDVLGVEPNRHEVRMHVAALHLGLQGVLARLLQGLHRPVREVLPAALERPAGGVGLNVVFREGRKGYGWGRG